MRVKAHAIIWIDGLLIVARQAGCGSEAELTLPGGEVNAHESIADALKREVSAETGLEIDPGPLLYAAILEQIASDARDHWRSTPRWLGATSSSLP